MNRITGTSIGSFILGAILLLLPAFVGAGPVPISVHCTGGPGGPTLAGRLNAAAASASRTLIVTGTCVENVTVRNLRVTIQGAPGATLLPLAAGSPAITFTGGTVDATIRDMIIDAAPGSGAIVVTNNASVTIRNNTIIVDGTDRGIDVRRGGLATISTNSITGAGASIGVDVREQALATIGPANVDGGGLAAGIR